MQCTLASGVNAYSNCTDDALREQHTVVRAWPHSDERRVFCRRTAFAGLWKLSGH